MKPSRLAQSWASAVNKVQADPSLMELTIKIWETDNEQMTERDYSKI